MSSQNTRDNISGQVDQFVSLLVPPDKDSTEISFLVIGEILLRLSQTVPPNVIARTLNDMAEAMASVNDMPLGERIH